MLNKNGWGIRSFIICGAILLLALILTAFFVIRLYSGLPNLTGFMIDPVDYQMIEETLNEKSLQYINKYYDTSITTGVIVVSTKNLLKYDLIEQKDLTQTEKNDVCEGYSLIRKEEDKLTSKSYITCDAYITEGYQSWRVNNG